jgi:hypothetical protein
MRAFPVSVAAGSGMAVTLWLRPGKVLRLGDVRRPYWPTYGVQ